MQRIFKNRTQIATNHLITWLVDNIQSRRTVLLSFQPFALTKKQTFLNFLTFLLKHRDENKNKLILFLNFSQLFLQQFTYIILGKNKFFFKFCIIKKHTNYIVITNANKLCCFFNPSF